VTSAGVEAIDFFRAKAVWQDPYREAPNELRLDRPNGRQQPAASYEHVIASVSAGSAVGPT
jgi:hypothetical protein